MAHDDPPAAEIGLSVTQVRQFIHDLRNSLHSIGIGLEMLTNVRDDTARFAEVLRLIRDEQHRAAERLEEFSRTVPRSIK